MGGSITTGVPVGGIRHESEPIGRFAQAERDIALSLEKQRIARESRRQKMNRPQKLLSDLGVLIVAPFNGISDRRELSRPVLPSGPRYVITRRVALECLGIGLGAGALALAGAIALKPEVATALFQDDEPTRLARNDLKAMHRTFDYHLTPVAYSGQFEQLSRESRDNMLAVLNRRNTKLNPWGVILDGLAFNDPNGLWELSDFPKDNTFAVSGIRQKNFRLIQTDSNLGQFSINVQEELARQLVRIPEDAHFENFQPSEEQDKLTIPNRDAGFLDSASEGFRPTGPDPVPLLPVLHARTAFNNPGNGNRVTVTTTSRGWLMVSIEYHSPDKKIIY